MDTATKTGLDVLKVSSKRVVSKVTKAICEFWRNKITDQILKVKSLNDKNLRNDG